ncbi:FAD binding domain-containing protein [Microtetraspora malaysiensis]|uniref:FAD binding domain-containing protein n=1 Tax=Microtetraspora malaysiensis TaxID=161358 RepID=UPI00083114F1|nr:FAD binding domain-containing protein [Microtetraspora malaysiensis]
MKPAPFAYRAPTSSAQAIALLAEHRGRARLLAGGQALMPLLASRQVRSPLLIDLNRVPDLAFVSRAERLRIGALTRLRRLEADPVVRAGAPLLAAAAALAGPVQVRNRATLGGALAHADPAAELPAVAVALDARVELRGSGVRHLPAADFFRGAHQTALDDGELLAAIEFPLREAAFAIEKIPARPGHALAGAVVVLGGEDRRLVLFGAGPVPLRPARAEAALAGGAAPAEVAEAAMADLDAAGVPEDVTRALARGALTRALDRARATARNQVDHG